MNGFKVYTTSNIAFNTDISYSKQIFIPNEIIHVEIKLTLTKAMMDSLGLFTIKLNVLGV